MRGPRTAMKSGPRLPQLEKALARNEDPTQPKIKKKFFKGKYLLNRGIRKDFLLSMVPKKEAGKGI